MCYAFLSQRRSFQQEFHRVLYNLRSGVLIFGGVLFSPSPEKKKNPWSQVTYYKEFLYVVSSSAKCRLKCLERKVPGTEKMVFLSCPYQLENDAWSIIFQMRRSFTLTFTFILIEFISIWKIWHQTYCSFETEPRDYTEIEQSSYKTLGLS